MSAEADQLLQDVHHFDAAVREAAIKQLADPKHHYAIPTLLEWLHSPRIYAIKGNASDEYLDMYDLYDEFVYEPRGWQIIGVSETASTVLIAIGDSVVPDVLSSLEQNFSKRNVSSIALLESAIHLPDIIPLVKHYRHVLFWHGDYSTRVRKLIEKHAPDMNLTDAKFMPHIFKQLNYSLHNMHPEWLYHLMRHADEDDVPVLLKHYCAVYERNFSGYRGGKRDTKTYQGDILRLIGRLGGWTATMKALGYVVRVNIAHGVGIVASVIFVLIVIALIIGLPLGACWWLVSWVGFLPVVVGFAVIISVLIAIWQWQKHRKQRKKSTYVSLAERYRRSKNKSDSM